MHYAVHFGSQEEMRSYDEGGIHEACSANASVRCYSARKILVCNPTRGAKLRVWKLGSSGVEISGEERSCK